MRVATQTRVGRDRPRRSTRVARTGLVLAVFAVGTLVGVLALGRAHGGSDPVLLGLALLALIGAAAAVLGDRGWSARRRDL